MKRYLTIGLIPFFALAQADVDVIFERHSTAKIEFHDGARLADLLFNVQLPDNIYWRTAQIANEKTIAAFQMTKEQLLKDLKALQVFWMREGDKGALIQSTQQLLQELDRIPISGRLPVLLDPAKTRVDPEGNPLLKGNYTLFVAPRPDFIYFVGLINGRSKQPLRLGASLASYWQDYRLLAGAAQHEAFLIQPDGAISRVPVANWNKLHREPMAGATLFVGFDPQIIPEQYKDINIRIANLIANRVPE
ncbi:capsule biosynthesis GfcC family protein [Aeromonas jandaei]|uniref:capsule biosynthesis GfcC family protein n=1 Tax=Aeromonas jandaei TaxID=650 RepID=UPI00191C975C|nr:capsule biosynthesis GfcC family protein [Aeromonas jandaei]MBL0625572.1 capsule biosynthesis GfcC family protein [Aeromonas jandaei]